MTTSGFSRQYDKYSYIYNISLSIMVGHAAKLCADLYRRLLVTLSSILQSVNSVLLQLHIEYHLIREAPKVFFSGQSTKVLVFH